MHRKLVANSVNVISVNLQTRILLLDLLNRCGTLLDEGFRLDRYAHVMYVLVNT